MKIGMPILYEYNSILENLILANRLGYDFVELNLNFGYCKEELLDKKKIKIIKKYLEENNLDVTIHFFDEADFAQDKEITNAYLKILKKYIKSFKYLNMKLMNFHINVGPIVTISGVKNYIYEKEYQNYIKRLIDNLKVIEKVGKRYNVQLVLENTKTPSFIERTYYDLQKEGFSFNYDVGHDYMENEFLREFYEKKMLTSLKEMHIHDSNKKQDHLAIGSGTMDIKYFKEIAKENEVYALLEVKSSDDIISSIEIFKNL